MITSVAGPSTPHGWAISEFEHEVLLDGGVLADLKASYGVDSLCVGTAALVLKMSHEREAVSVELRWNQIERLHVETSGPRVTAEDGRVGLIGLRLMPAIDMGLIFEIELDWLHVEVSCTSFAVSHGAERRPHP